MRVSGEGRRCLFLQGPHGPFFQQLGAMLQAAGASVRRVGFNRGDRAFWTDTATFIPYRGTLEDWPGALEPLLTEHAITDIVLYGDTRPIHAAAVSAARARGRRPLRRPDEKLAVVTRRSRLSEPNERTTRKPLSAGRAQGNTL